MSSRGYRERFEIEIFPGALSNGSWKTEGLFTILRDYSSPVQ